MCDENFYAVFCYLFTIVLTGVGSKYYENEKRKDMQIEDRIARQKEELDRLTDQQKIVALAKVTHSAMLCSLCDIQIFCGYAILLIMSSEH